MSGAWSGGAVPDRTHSQQRRLRSRQHACDASDGPMDLEGNAKSVRGPNWPSSVPIVHSKEQEHDGFPHIEN